MNLCPKCNKNSTIIVDGVELICADCAAKISRTMAEDSIAGKLINANVPPRYKDASLSDFTSGTIIEEFQADKGVVVVGHAGKGKTHYLCAIARELLLSGNDVMFVNAAGILDDLRDFDNSKDLFKKMSAVPYLLIDDFGAYKSTEWTYDRLYALINKRYNDMLHTSYSINGKLTDLADVRVLRRILDSTEKVEL